MSQILFVIASRSNQRQVYGGEKSTLATAEGLAREGHRAHFLVTAWDGLAQEISEHGFALDVVEVCNPTDGFRSASIGGRLKRVRDLMRVNRAVWRRCRGARVDIVHAAAVPGFFCSWLGAKLAGAKTIYHVRTASRGQQTRWFEELAILLADRTIAVSESLRAQLLETGHALLRPLLERRIETIPNGFDFGRLEEFFARETREACRARLGVPAESKCVLVVGSLFVDKGQLRFIRQVVPAVAAADPAVRFVFVGGEKDSAYAQACRDAVEALGLASRVTFTGYLSQPEVFAWYRASDVAVLPSEREGLPRSAIEAQAFRLPVVGTAVVGTVEAVDDGRTGYLVKIEEVGRMVEPLLLLLGDEDKRRALGAAGATRVRERFSLAKNVERIDRCYQELLA